MDLRNVGFVTASLILVGFGLGEVKAIAQTTYPFEAVYNLEVTTKEIAPGISLVNVIGESDNAPYGLTNLTSMSYSQLDPATGVSTAGPDAAAFGLEGLPILTDKFFGNGDDSLIGTSTATVSSDLQNLTGSAFGTITITGGTGRFNGAEGTLTLSDSYTISPDPTAPIIGQAFVNGSFQTSEKVPEPRNNAALVGIGLLGTGFLLRRINKKTQKANI